MKIWQTLNDINIYANPKGDQIENSDIQNDKIYKLNKNLQNAKIWTDTNQNNSPNIMCNEMLNYTRKPQII